MPRVVGYDAAIAAQFMHRNAMRTPFLNSGKDDPRPTSPEHNVEFPVAFLSQGEPGRVINSHYHLEDEFLLVAEGGGVLGRNPVAPYTVFFARAFTPYGPLVGDSKTGVAFFVLSARFETGAQWLPEKTQTLKDMPNRRPLQIARPVTFSEATSAAPVQLNAVADIKDDQGLFACTITLAANASTTAPDPTHGDGQFLVVTKGTLLYQGQEYKPYTVVFVEPKEGAFTLKAGADGMQAVIMNFPQVGTRAVAKAAAATASGFKKWQCVLCAFAYDEAAGLPNDGIPAGTRWADVPDTWTCPDCGASKSDFEMVEVA